MATFDKLSEVDVVDDVAKISFVVATVYDDHEIATMADRWYHLIENGGIRKMLIDFNGVKSWASGATGKIVTLNRKMKAAEGKLVLCGMSDDVREIFKITRLDHILVIKGTEEEALLAL